MEHYLIRATLIPSIVERIAETFNLSEKTALSKFYESTTGQLFADDSTGLYGQSALYIYGMFKDEYESTN